MLNKFKKIFKGRRSIFTVGLILGVIVSASGVYAANTVYSKNVTYDNSNSGLESTNVQDALDETYNTCFPPGTIATEKVINLYNDGSSINTVNIGGSTSNPEVHLNATQGIMLDNNGDYRYYGANPNNYVTFNGETWRIIGVFNNVDDGTGKKEKRLKIIRDESIGNYSWGDRDVDTGESDLMTALNDLYYNSKSGVCPSENSSISCDFTTIGLDQNSKNMIEFANYNIGDAEGSSVKYANDFYNAENDLKWNGRIGIMNASDYMYATDLGLCHTIGSKYGKDSGNTECTNNDWLFDDSYFQWTMTPQFSGRMNYISFEGNVSDAVRFPSEAYIIRPVAYLKSDVTIVGGEGTSSNPYTLGLK